MKLRVDARQGFLGCTDRIAIAVSSAAHGLQRSSANLHEASLLAAISSVRFRPSSTGKFEWRRVPTGWGVISQADRNTSDQVTFTIAAVTIRQADCRGSGQL
jgi:hypothetical protein